MLSRQAYYHLQLKNDVWIARVGYTKYADDGLFYQPIEQWSSALVGRTKIIWDSYACTVKTTEDPLGNQTLAEYDYRFLLPTQITDINGNVSIVELDALGRAVSSRFWGMENGANVGFPTPGEVSFSVPASVQEAVDTVAPVPVAAFNVYNPFGWMPQYTALETKKRKAFLE